MPMITVEELVRYCCDKPKSYIDFPFGEEPICVKLNKKIFAQIYPKEGNYKITLKCDINLADFFRTQYPDVVVRGYHCPSAHQPYWNTVWVNNLEDKILFSMIDHSYEQVLMSFSKKLQVELLGDNPLV